MNWDFSRDPSTGSHELDSHWPGGESEEVMVNVFRGRRSTSSFTVRIFSTSILHTGERHYIAKIRKLSRIVSAYAQNKDASIAAALEQKGTDELSSLMGQTAAMMLEMDDYMKNLVKTTEELSHTRAQVDIEAKIARKDALTGIRNRNAYEEELRRLAVQLA